MENSNDDIGNRTRDLPACSAVTQPTEPPRGIYVNCDLFSDAFYIQLFKKSSVFKEFTGFYAFLSKPQLILL